MSTPPPAPPSQPYGGHTVAEAVEAILRRELPAWSTSQGLGVVQSWDVVPTMAALSTASLPAGAIAVAGTAEQPERHADGYSGDLDLGVGVYCRGEGYTSTYGLASRWAACVRTVLLAHPVLDLPGVVQSITWTGDDLAVANPDSSRTLGAASVNFTVHLPDLASFTLRPPAGDGTPPTPLPVVERIEVHRDVVGPDQPLVLPDLDPDAEPDVEVPVPH